MNRRSQISKISHKLLGREVMMLVNEKQHAGMHQAHFDGGRLTSGVYLYRLEAVPSGASDFDRFIQTRRMLLIK
ncbi:hypothetical protein QA596_09460 [Balneolales bacterium ANBcel1]|nr:hypothetical protein [Balneolales bacterium ANBcel1]